VLILCALANQSAARPLLGSGFDGYRSALLHDSILLRQIIGTSVTPQQAAPQSNITFTNPRLLLSTPKSDVPSLGEVKHLSISTVFRTHREYTDLAPILRFNASLSAGARKIVRVPLPKIVAITERITLWNSVVVDREMVSRTVVQRARPAIIVVAPPRSVAEAMKLTGARKLGPVYSMVATAYTADSAQAYPTGRTATGIPAHYGVVAVDPRVIPLGTLLYVERYGAAIAADTGGAIIGNRIDLCMDSYQRAIDWGRRPVKVYILRTR
jgi:3D (Asp-Asp-Asp) domain-containing protein